jgi:hypothetical protein
VRADVGVQPERLVDDDDAGPRRLARRHGEVRRDLAGRRREGDVRHRAGRRYRGSAKAALVMPMVMARRMTAMMTATPTLMGAP